jgi:sec-independent protein translocase protein TatA
MPSGYEWFIILGVVLLIFGGSQLPKLARNIGKAQKEFKDGLAEGAAAEKPDSEKTPEELAAELAAARKEAADAKAQAAARTETPATTPPDPTSN